MLCPFRNFFLLNLASHAQGQPYWATLRKGLEGFGGFSGGRACAEGHGS
jgi:hypothetical protein